MATTLPPWIASIDPIAPVPLALRGFGLGAQVGESVRQGEQQSAQFNAELSARQARADQEYAQHMAMENEKIKTAARNTVGMQTYHKLIQQGVPKADALVQAAPDLFYNRAYDLPNALHQIGQEEQAAQNAAATEAYRASQLDIDRQRLAQEAAKEARITKGLTGPIQGQKVFVDGKEVPAWFGAPSPGGGVGLHQYEPRSTTPGKMTDVDKMDKFTLQTELKNAQTDWDKQGEELKKALEDPAARAKLSKAEQASLDRLQQKKVRLDTAKSAWDSFHERVKSGVAPTVGGASEPLELPANPTKQSLQKGKPYKTRMGILTWDGTNFVR